MRHRETIPADATVDRIAGIVGGGGGFYKVTVTSPLLLGVVRIYTIEAGSDTMAAREGLRRFEEEFSSPPKLLVN